jgi:hypothetical protein
LIKGHESQLCDIKEAGVSSEAEELKVRREGEKNAQFKPHM